VLSGKVGSLVVGGVKRLDLNWYGCWGERGRTDGIWDLSAMWMGGLKRVCRPRSKKFSSEEASSTDSAYYVQLAEGEETYALEQCSSAQRFGCVATGRGPAQCARI
jgi:hypothetical protein